VAPKRWLLEHGDDAAYRDAMKACDMAHHQARDRGEEGAVAMALPAGRADDKVGTAKPGGADVHGVSGGD